MLHMSSHKTLWKSNLTQRTSNDDLNNLIQVGWNNIPKSCVIRPITLASLIRRRKHVLFASSLPTVFLPAENSTFAFMKRNHMFFTSPHLIPIILQRIYLYKLFQKSIISLPYHCQSCPNVS